MIKFENYLQKLDKNKQGGLNPETDQEKKMFKRVDLITLPEGVAGTNCGNCKHVEDVKDGAGFCAHPDIKHKVTARMCCAKWDNSGVVRLFK